MAAGNWGGSARQAVCDVQGHEGSQALFVDDMPTVEVDVPSCVVETYIIPGNERACMAAAVVDIALPVGLDVLAPFKLEVGYLAARV